jgi:hypothetical protein
VNPPLKPACLVDAVNDADREIASKLFALLEDTGPVAIKVDGPIAWVSYPDSSLLDDRERLTEYLLEGYNFCRRKPVIGGAHYL